MENINNQTETINSNDIGLITINSEGLLELKFALDESMFTEEEKNIIISCTNILHNVMSSANNRLTDKEDK